MQVSFYLNKKEVQRNILSAFARGVKAHNHTTEMREAVEGLNADSDLHVVMGFQDECDTILKECKEKSLDYIFIDHAYFNRGYDKGNFRVVKNGLVHNDWTPRRTDRLRKLNLTPGRWRQMGSIILLITPPVIPTDRRCDFDALGWTEEAIFTLHKHSTLPIVIHHKFDPKPMTEYLMNAKALVAHNSIAAVESALYGVPVFVHESNPAAPVGQTNLARIEQPIYPDRENWLACLSYGQFSMNELESGLAFDVVFGEGKEHGD